MKEAMLRALAPFLDEEGRLLQYPAKRKKKIYALLFLAEKFEKDKLYSEGEVNDLLESWHTFHDPATLRRELYQTLFLDRTANGSVYRLSDAPPTLGDLEKKFF